MKFSQLATLRKSVVRPEDFHKYDAYLGYEHFTPGTLHFNTPGAPSTVISNKQEFRPGDTIYGRLRPYFRKVGWSRQLTGICSTDFWVLQPHPGVDPRFVFYVAGSQSFTELANSSSEGTRMPRASWAVVKDFEVPNFSLREQREIAATLGALDDKIESNRRLGERASALIDAAASELLARTSTEVIPLAELVEFNQLTVKPSSTAALRYIDIASVSPGRIEVVQELTWDEAPSRARRGVSDGDVIYSTVRPGRRSFALIIDPSPNSVASTGFAVMSPSRRLGSSMLTSVVGSPEFADYLETVAHGSAYPAVSIQAMGNYSVVVPKDVSQAEQFEECTMPLRRRVAQAHTESERLADLRDALLPELLSGRAQVPVEGDAA